MQMQIDQIDNYNGFKLKLYCNELNNLYVIDNYEKYD